MKLAGSTCAQQDNCIWAHSGRARLLPSRSVLEERGSAGASPSLLGRASGVFWERSLPWIVDYEQVLSQMKGQGLRCLYYNSGAFGFADGAAVHSLGWIGPEDSSLRPSARELAVQVDSPHEATLSELTVRAWQDDLPGKVWLMPKSHWAYELDFGSRDWMPSVLERAGIDPGLLQSRTNAAAIEFNLDELNSFKHVIEGLLRMLLGSDFALAFPGRQVVCTIHHHKQVWWQSTDAPFIDRLRRMIA